MNKKGFTLVELLAVIAILAVLVIITLPNIMDLFTNAKKNSFEGEVKNIYKTVEQQVMVDSIKSPNTSEITYSSSSTSENHLSLKGRSNLKYCVVVNGANKITKLYISDGNYQYISEDINELSNIENIHVEELADEDLENIENCEMSSTNPSLFTYTVSNNKVTITGLNNFEIVDSQKCINYFTENHPIRNCAWNQTNYCTASDVNYQYCGGTPKTMLLGIIPESDYEEAGLKVLKLKRLVIPEEIDGNPVTSIGAYAFLNNNIEYVKIPNSVITIDRYAFSYNNLTSITIPDSVTTLKTGSFSHNNLTSITIPDSVTTLESESFSRNNLTSITIPDSVTTLGTSAFANNNLSSAIISNNLVEISDYAFSYNNLTSITIPSSVTTIKRSAFYNNNLTSITIPSSVRSISSWVFADNNLESVIINGKTSSSGFTTYGDNIWGWKSDITCTRDNTSNVTNGCITWNAS